MKTKLEMAHEYALQLSKNPSVTATHNDKDITSRAWQYADAMQAEADKREPSGFPNVLRGACGEIVAVKVDDKEWQPDWSQAPEWADWWAMDGFSNQANWYDSEPYIDGDSEIENEWNIELKANMETYEKAPSFNYNGNWQDSLRKRPQ